MKRYYFTYFDRNYLVKGMALIESLQSHEKNDYAFFVICADEYTRLLLKRLAYKNVSVIGLHEVESGNATLYQARRNRNLVEYYWSLKAVLALYIFERHPHIDLLTYFDADLFFFSAPQPIFDGIGDDSVLIHAHRFAPEQKALAMYGRYNAGFFSVRRDAHGLAALKWWRDQCMQWCYARLENGKYGDQLYLDSFAEKLKGVAEIEHIGVGVAPWNHIQYRFSRDEAGQVYVDGDSLVFYHFHSLAFVDPEIIIPSQYISNPLSTDILKYCFVPYADQLQESIKRVRELVPDFKFGLSHSRILTDKHTFIAKRSQHERIKNSNLPQHPVGLNDTWDCYGSEQLRDAARWKRGAPSHSSGPEIAPVAKSNPSQNALLYAKSEYDRGNKETAISLLRQLTEKWPGNGLMEMTLGEMLWKEGEQEAALNCLLNAYTNQPDEPRIAAKLFNMLVQTEQPGTGSYTADDNAQRYGNRIWEK